MFLGRAENKTPDSAREAASGAPDEAEKALASMTAEEASQWRAAVAAYANGLSRKDAIFDEAMFTVTKALADAGDAASLQGVPVDPAVAKVLESAAAVYRKVWWPSHREANQKWHQKTQEQVDRHGRAVLAYITRAYGMEWPSAGFAVHVSAYSNWAGAYSTSGNLLVVASRPPSSPTENLETVFHEGMHQWDDRMIAALREEGRKAGKRVTRNLSHAMIFFTAGEAVRKQIPDYVPMAEAGGIWNRGMARLRPVLRQVWQPYLEGKGSRDEALAALIAAAPADPPR
ncbi:MAG: hypothetical protein K2X35_02440 [Bryobacteraceae bacterium]|nr:hypothetical protein [Bryobacteraceae bacterium]